jgi:hypothetical protein
MTEGGDIRFRVYIKKSKGNVVDVIPLDRVDSHLAMEEDQFTCDEPGKCKLHLLFCWFADPRFWLLELANVDVFEFDNTFSYLRIKKLHYYIYFDPPL